MVSNHRVMIVVSMWQDASTKPQDTTRGVNVLCLFKALGTASKRPDDTTHTSHDLAHQSESWEREWRKCSQREVSGDDDDGELDSCRRRQLLIYVGILAVASAPINHSLTFFWLPTDLKRMRMEISRSTTGWPQSYTHNYCDEVMSDNTRWPIITTSSSMLV